MYEHLELSPSALESEVPLPGQLLQGAGLRQDITEGQMLLLQQHLYQVQQHADLTLQVIFATCFQREADCKTLYGCNVCMELAVAALLTRVGLPSAHCTVNPSRI